ncbi:MAG: hypothetical protein RIQ81_1095 [Pseudomonadota bacterium]|jgi:hypothetical protein
MNQTRQTRKKSYLPWIILSGVIVVALAIFTAVQTGQKSPLYASGTVEITPELVSAAKGMRTLYLVALPPAESGMRMPFGAARFNVNEDASGKFLNFTLTPEIMQLMPGAGGVMPDEFRLKARLDADGAGGADQPGDLVGEVSTVKLGTEGILITINRVASGTLAP